MSKGPCQRDQPYDLRIKSLSQVIDISLIQRYRGGPEMKYSHLDNNSINHAYIIRLNKNSRHKTQLSFMVGKYLDGSGR